MSLSPKIESCFFYQLYFNKANFISIHFLVLKFTTHNISYNVSKIILYIRLQVLVEFDLQDWQKRDWLNVYKDNSHLLLIEENLVLAPRTVEPFSKEGVLHPALVSF